ncbi:hypothetical protein GCM10010256_84050 [Streptomyces coeruleorubidus]|uniref:Uncharacterized protein n=1 Tax=Streptomyces coeruleorubidus TaxID=116188 RepID=A0A5J6IJH8_STRC4|nr:hypothetical protein CP976_35595 [Streptomyces coeruleorubidus]GGU11787.1 hypothetical protein GCM10010256_84050 [Streptomyces coeruleorubidus]
MCRVRGASTTAEDLIPLATEAFRVDDEDVITEPAAVREGVLALPSAVAAAGAMVVLGEPGAGKTFMLEALTTGLPRVLDSWERNADACLWVSGADLTEASYQDELGRHLDALPSAGEAADDAGVLTVVLDQTDESSLRPYLPRRLQKSLRNRDTSRIRLLMACRTADYPGAMTPVLSEAFRVCQCVDLAPLSRREAVALADSAQVPGEELVTAAETAGAAVLASVPLTLELLVLTYRADGQLHGTPEELFARGVEWLADDPDPDRLNGAVFTTPPQRLRAAGRIAAWMLLSGRRSVWRGPAFSAGAFDLPGGLLAGGEERTAAGSYEITPKVLEETLATALFTAPDDNRTAFRHSSVAAFLAARYLTDRDTTQRQLENLFLVGAPAGGAASIPPPLRETAAWLVALNPTATEWLADADPESLAVHSALVRSDEVRRLTVTRLLERAPEVELGDTRWELSRWDLRHPLLADQLADVLENVASDNATDWQVRARVRLAVRLAQEAGSANSRLAGELLGLVEDDTWHQVERRLAARAAFACDADRAVPVLKRVLASLAQPSYAKRVDADHDLRGTVLALLWPQYLDVATMLAALRPPSPHLYGMNADFLRTMPVECPDDQLPQVLAWAQATVLQPRSSKSGFVFASHRIETRLIDSLIDRVLGSQDSAQHLETLAKIIFCLLRGHNKVRIPDCLQPDEHGDEPADTQSTRRLLTEALVGEAVRLEVHPREAAWLIVDDWELPASLRWNAASVPDTLIRHQLVDGADFAWALEQTSRAAASGDTGLVAAYGELAARLFPHNDHEAFELAYDEDHPAWPYLRPYYDPIDLRSELATALRRSHRVKNKSWPEAPEFAVEQVRLLTAAREGDNDSLWQLLWRLRADPRTGLLESPTGPIRSWPGATALADDLADLPELALRYLTTEHDHADSWLAQSRHDKRSWAGYVLLLEIHSEHNLSELPSPAWSSWTAAILTEYLGTSTSYTEAARRDLLWQAASHAPESLSRRITQLVPDALAHARQPIELHPLDPRWARELQTAMEALAMQLSACLGLAQIEVDAAGQSRRASEGGTWTLPDGDEAREAALRTWYDLLRSLLASGSKIADGLIDAALRGRSESPGAANLFVRAAQALLGIDAERNWSRVKTLTATDADLGRQLAEACTQTEIHSQIQGALNEAQLADLYVWLSDLYPDEAEGPRLGVHWVSASEEACQWRDGLPRELSRRATAEAVRQLRRLSDQYPHRLSLAAALGAATKHHAAAIWSRVGLDDVVRVLQDPSRRVIRTSTDLLDVVHEVLEHVGNELPPHGELLWDRTPGRRPRSKSASTTVAESVPETWRPKLEAALCAYLAHELTLRLAGHRVAVNREVMIYPTDAYGAGDRTDILIDAAPSSSDEFGTAADGHVKLVIEVKGSWNRGVATSQEEQLAGRYLPEAMTDVGIYLVGWYPVELWDDPSDNRRARAKKLDFDTLVSDLKGQALRLSQTDSVHLRPMVITIPRPHRQVDL